MLRRIEADHARDDKRSLCVERKEYRFASSRFAVGVIVGDKEGSRYARGLGWAGLVQAKKMWRTRWFRADLFRPGALLFTLYPFSD